MSTIPKKMPTVSYDTDGRKTIKLYSYVAVMCEKDGSRVQAIRCDGYARKADAIEAAEVNYPEWNVKGIYKLYDEDFE